MSVEHQRWFLTALAELGTNLCAAFAAVTVVVAIRNDSVGWLVASSLGLVGAVACIVARRASERADRVG